MSIRPDSPWRGCAAYYPQPIGPHDEGGAQDLTERLYHLNCPPLADIEYRPSSNTREEDIVHHVFRWDDAPFQEIFQNGFRARPEQGTPDEVYFSLEHCVNHGGRPGRPGDRPHAFISTTLSSSWHPVCDPGTTRDFYRYEIYAPGGIWVAETLGDLYRYPSQNEICFVAGIAPQYIRSAQLFRLTTTHPRYTRRERVNDDLIFNAIFNPQSHPLTLVNIQNPVDYYYKNGRRVELNIRYYTPDGHLSRRKKREAEYNSDDTTINWYADTVVNSQSYTIDAAFRSSRKNEAYIFMKNEYVLLNYAPNTTEDRVVNGPLLICDGFPSLAETPFAEYGIDCAFRCRGRDCHSFWDPNEFWDNEKNEAFIFSLNLCARINYAPGTTDDRIIRGPKTIAGMFPFFKGTVFEKGIDAAFESSYAHEAYLFKDNRYALINYSSDSCHLTAIRFITQGFPSLRKTVFESGIDAAFASHIEDRAYLFKGDFYAQINFAPRTTDDYIVGGVVKEILPNWPSLRSILPRGNQGLDVHVHAKPDEDRDHDEL